jgi:hypothetical protein
MHLLQCTSTSAATPTLAFPAPLRDAAAGALTPASSTSTGELIVSDLLLLAAAASLGSVTVLRAGMGHAAGLCVATAGTEFQAADPSDKLCSPNTYGNNGGYYIVYDSVVGDVGLPSASDSALAFSRAVTGLAPHQGTFSLSLGPRPDLTDGSTLTALLPSDATAAEVATSLNALSGICAVSVSAAVLGLDGYGHPFSSAWAVTFASPGGVSPSNWGRVPTLTAGAAGQLAYPDSASSSPPALQALVAASGTAGNPRPYSASEAALLTVSLSLATAPGTGIAPPSPQLLALARRACALQ